MVFVLAIGGCGGGDSGGSAADRDSSSAPPAADARIPREPKGLADRLTTTQRGLGDAIDA
jgi:hypothetical protein